MYRDFGTVLLAALIAIVFVCVPLILQWLVAPSNKTAEKLQTYECGEVVEGSALVAVQYQILCYSSNISHIRCRGCILISLGCCFQRNGPCRFSRNGYFPYDSHRWIGICMGEI